VLTGRGGIPEDLSKQVLGDYPWLDTRALSGVRSGAVDSRAQPPVAALVEASTLQINAQGQLELLARGLPMTAPVATCVKK
jgi:hypothetical protein